MKHKKVSQLSKQARKHEFVQDHEALSQLENLHIYCIEKKNTTVGPIAIIPTYLYTNFMK